MTRSSLRWLTMFTASVAAACSHASANGHPTERQVDSAIGQSRLPGAAGVRGALRVSDSAAARRARLDSLANDQ
jgi:hypothetical protein